MGVKISALPSVAVPALSDVFPIVQSGVTYKESIMQLSTLITSSAITITGTADQITASAPTGAVTLSLPQDIATTSDVTFGSVAFSPTTKGIVGTATNNNAAAGFVGEYVSNVIATGAAVNIPTITATNLTSILLQAGDWEVWGNIFCRASGSNLTEFAAWISLVSATAPDGSLINIINSSSLLANSIGMNAPYFRAKLSGSATIYLSGYAVFGAGTAAISGGIYANRVR